MSGIKLVTPVPGPRSLAIAARRDAAGARGASRLTDLAVVGGHGPYVVDADGNRLLDFAGGIGVLAVGHTPEGVVSALQDQAERLIHLCAIVGTYEPYVRVLETLCELAPGDFPKKAVLMNSGAEALETAVNVARAYTGRQAVVVFEGAYHGRTNLTLGMTSKYALFKKGFGPFAPEIYRLPFPDLYRRPAGMSEDAFLDMAIAALDKAMVAQVDPGGLGGTYSGNPLACVAALEALAMLGSEAFLARAVQVGERLRAGLERIAAEQPAVGEVRGLGPMLAMEFVRDRATKEPFPELVLDVTKQALKRGLIVIRAGLYSNCIRLLPPLNMTDAEVDEGLAVLKEAVAAAAALHAPAAEPVA
ncbi:MAG: aminotransferase class III-fold pyridoxal phosphate-dependent enzyme [Trueperaceae bacterium]|nr:aminotransferase class III-fold pyridoxal phosphate-dependent enzyme [Trueperaceae bacterium]